MVLSRLTKITGPGVATDTNWVGNNADFTGITTTATSFNTSRTGSEIPYDNVTQDNVISWVQNGFVGVTTVGVGTDAITTTGIELEKSNVTDHLYVLYTRKPPTSGTGTPW